MNTFEETIDRIVTLYNLVKSLSPTTIQRYQACVELYDETSNLLEMIASNPDLAVQLKQKANNIGNPYLL